MRKSKDLDSLLILITNYSYTAFLSIDHSKQHKVVLEGLLRITDLLF